MADRLLHGTTLVNAKGETIDGGDVGQSGLLALYFAANWCPDCRAFQRKLNEFYDQVNTPTQQLDVVFLSSDMNEEDQLAHFSEKHGPWWMAPRSSDIRNELRRKYGIRNGKDDVEVAVTHRIGGIPALVLIRPNGEVLDFQGVQQVESDGVQALMNWQTKVAQ